MPAVNLSTLPRQVFSNSGNPGAGYRLFTYDAGSFSTLKTTYSDAAGTVPLPNPIVADNTGRLPTVWLQQDETYNVALTLPDGTTVVQTWVDIQGVISFGVVQDIIDSGVFLPTAGGTISGALTVTGVTTLNTTIVNGQLSVPGTSSLGTVTATSITGALNANNQRVTSVGAPVSGTDATTKTYVDAVAAAATAPVGAVVYTAAASAPTGWLIADGTAVSRTTYATLFAAIGTTYGSGDGSTTFNLPDLRGVFARGTDLGRGLDPGRVLGTYQADALASHTHGGVPLLIDDSDRGGNSSSFSIDNVGNTASTGGAETRPKNLALTPIIKH